MEPGAARKLFGSKVRSPFLFPTLTTCTMTCPAVPVLAAATAAPTDEGMAESAAPSGARSPLPLPVESPPYAELSPYVARTPLAVRRMDVSDLRRYMLAAFGY